jgi:uncharacterized membrane protein HdeD (DUF308 family)
MDSLLERAGKATEKEINRVRLVLGINGILSLAFGVVILVWPGISLRALTIVFGIYAALAGIFALSAVLGGVVRQSRGWLVVWGLASIAVGVLTFVWTDISALALLYVIGAYAVAIGIITVGGAFWLPLDSGDRAMLALAGFVCILFGIVMFAKPGDGALVLLALIAAFALVRGATEVVIAIGGKRLLERDVKRAVQGTRPPQPASS